MLSRHTVYILICLLMAFAAIAAGAQTDSPLSPDKIAAQIRPMTPKTVVLVFDVTGSTRANGVFQNERAASATIIRDGCEAGDRVVLEKFGTGYTTVFDTALTSDADKDALIDKLPSSVEPGAGTNIRWPHAEALKLVKSTLPHPGVIVLLTDSFNDRPLKTDPNYPKYLDYYSLKGLTIYPNTPENREYERLLRTLKGSGKLYQYGVGVGIAKNGRPIERLPVGPGEGDDSTDATTALAPTVLAPTGNTQKRNSYIVPLGLGLLVVILIIAYFATIRRPIPVRLRLGDKGTPRDYRLRHGAKIALGGSPTAAGPGDENFPLAGLPTPPAFVEGERGGALLVPAPEPPADVAVFHNGIRLEKPTPLRVGDEIRIALPATESAPPREHRIHFADPRAEAF